MLLKLFDGSTVAPGLNFSDFAFLPKGSAEAGRNDLIDCVRQPGQTRPLSLKNQDAKAIAAAINWQLKVVAEKHTDTSQQGFVAGRNFAKHIVQMDCEARAASLDPSALTQHPVFLSFDFASAFPSLSRKYLGKVLERFKLPLGYRLAVSGLYSHMTGFVRIGGRREVALPILSGVAQGCPLSGTLWALGLDPFLRLLSRALSSSPAPAVPSPSSHPGQCAGRITARISAPPQPARSATEDSGTLGACADDIGMVLRQLERVRELEPHFSQLRRVASLRLQPIKCVLVPLWTSLTPDLAEQLRAELRGWAPGWATFQICGKAKYLGTWQGPEATLADEWRAPALKWSARCMELGELQSSADLASRLYNSAVLTCTSYVAQFFPVDKALNDRELWGLHKALHLPPNSFSRSEFLSLANWSPSPTPTSLLTNAKACAWRCASVTLDTIWGPLYRRLEVAAQESLSLPALSSGTWCAPCWARKQAIVQYYHELASAAPASNPPLSSSHLRLAQQRARGAVRAAIALNRRPRMQGVYQRSLAGDAYPDQLQLLIGRRLRTWFSCPTPIRLRERWDLVRDILSRAPPMVRWPYIKTIAGGWTTTHRMHVTDTKWSCIFGCPQPDRIAHYLVCPRLTHLVCRPRAVVSSCPLLRLGLGLPVQYPAFDLTRENAILATALSFYIYHVAKEMASHQDGRPLTLPQQLDALKAALAKMPNNCSILPPPPNAARPYRWIRPRR